MSNEVENTFTAKREALKNFYQSESGNYFQFMLHGLLIELQTSIPRELIPFALKSSECTTPDLIVELKDQKEVYKSDFPWDHEGDDQVVCNEDISFQRDFALKRQSNDHYQAIIDSGNLDGIYNLLRYLIPPYLAKKQRLILHSSSVAINETEAILFLGHSTYGKTTIAELGAPRPVLSDDMNTIEVRNNQILVTSSLLGGRISHTADKSFVVKKIFWLQKSSHYSIVEMPLSRGILCLMASVPSYTQLCKINNGLPQFLSLVAGLCPPMILNFPKTKEIWHELDPR